MPLQTLTSLGGPLFVPPCAFCPAPSVALCDWPVEKLQRIDVGGEITRGQTVYGASGTAGVVEFLERIDGKIKMVIKHAKSNRRETYCAAPESWKVYDYRPAACRIPCCDLHRRSVDEARNYCREHWDAWEKAA